MVETLSQLEAGTITPIPQDEDDATLAPILKREDGAIDFRVRPWRYTIAGEVFSPGPEPTPLSMGRSSSSRVCSFPKLRSFLQGDPAKYSSIRDDGFWRVQTTVWLK